MREGLCPTCKAEINESMQVCPNCGTPILWDAQAQGYPPQAYAPIQGPPSAGYPTAVPVKKVKTKKRHQVAAFFALIFSFAMFLGANIPWILFSNENTTWEEHMTLEEFDDAFGTNYHETLVVLAILLMLLSFLSLFVYHPAIKGLMLFLGFVAFVVNLRAMGKIAKEMNDIIIISDIWLFGPGPFLYIVGIILFMISTLVMRSPKKAMAVMMPQQPYGVPPRVQ